MKDGLGARAADAVASFGGSWNFVFVFLGTLCTWIFIFPAIWGKHDFDPFPYILLNLILSSLAGLQAPFIMMSQNRQEARDRIKEDQFRAEQNKTDRHLLTIGEAQLAHMETQAKFNDDMDRRLARIEKALGIQPE